MTYKPAIAFLKAIIAPLSFVLLFSFGCQPEKPYLKISQGAHISLIGNNLCSRMMNYGYFETEMQLRYPDSELYIRNMCDGGDTPGFRPHSGRISPWAFPGAEKFQTDLAQNSGSEGHFETPDEWLARHKTDIIIACFGFSESYAGPEGVDNFKAELSAFIEHTFSQKYNDSIPPQLVLVSPIAFQDLSDKYDLPNGDQENRNLSLYANAIKEVALQYQVLFVDAFGPTQQWFAEQQLTIDGLQLNDEGYQKFSKLLVDETFGKKEVENENLRASVKEAVLEKNWFWHNDYKIPNGVHVFGRRYRPFGNENYPEELIKVRQMTAIRDTAIWKVLKGEKYELAVADAKTQKLTPIETNYTLTDNVKYMYGDELMSHFKMAPGYKIELFASEEDFPELANPSQISFDNRGRLWVAVMPTYPHYKPGDARPDDKLVILEDTDGDFKADKVTVFADKLHIPAGFEFAPEGVYVSQGTNLKLYTDTDGDDKADKVEIILSGFDDHDTHHVISAFSADPSGAIYMGEGVFLHTNVETPYGTVRATNGGFYRYNPQRKRLERTAQLSIPNPWGIAFDEWGQNFFAHTSGPDVNWMMPGSIKSKYGLANPGSRNLIEEKHRVRPTSGLEFVHSRHFPDEVQGDMLINNTIGFLGTKMHQVMDDGTGFKTRHRLDLVVSDDPNFRPVDMEFAPDGSLYLADWHNVLVGHMQHNARDPLRDHVHGKIYRITYPSRPLVTPAKVDGASIEELLDNLKLPEYRTRYRSRRELRERETDKVLAAIEKWTNELDKTDPNYERLLLEGLWASWGMNAIDLKLLRTLLKADDYKVRTASVRVLRYTRHQVSEQAGLLKMAAADENSRVRLEAIVAASWLDDDAAREILAIAARKPLDDWMEKPYQAILDHMVPYKPEIAGNELVPPMLSKEEQQLFLAGKEIYMRDGYCNTCHQPDGKGLEASGFPPLSGNEWVQGSEERLIKITLKGLYGPITVAGKDYPGQVPMTPFGGLLNDQEIAAVLTYVRSSFGNLADAVTPEKVKEVRESSSSKTGFYTPEELLKEHPHENDK
ncbi:MULTISPECIES: PVC-type heme-binding CxxCH protein [unclassified Imperialibacter]|uniref:PVC-type heme-binding CxxCH protein n=1 Tax=unclassified Imperialibacter TaxID=2629706 RepID=UPI001253DED7|nr:MULTISPECIES: PVC-type heme-binding CxxCH protein [unclassified Imperialibacter]CAD5257092.1 Dehydrogenase [Imperialibacter sp. 75]CAD5259967.1 Dehydrogenase [Imperialibacter sp. 89]VVT25901.1 Dehydrogenase [Imperialibacter sp. EC-SDR9]